MIPPSRARPEPHLPMYPKQLAARLTVLLCAAALVGCATTSSGERRSSGDPELITFEEIRSSEASDVYTLIARLRPRWLQTRGRQSIIMPEDVMVYLDNARYGGLASLRNLSTGGVTSLTYVDGRTATQRWGLNHGHGAIIVSTAPPDSR